MEQQIPPEQHLSSKDRLFQVNKSWIILLFLALFVFIGGYYILARDQSFWPFNKDRTFTTSRQSPEDKFQKPLESIDTGAIVMVIKKENYDHLISEISTWVKDVEKETKYKVEIKVYENNINKEKVKADLKNLYYSKNLRGAVLVGNIPYARAGIHCSSYPEQVLPCLDFNSADVSPFDTKNLNIDYYFYVDIENKCQYNQKLDAFYTDSCSNDSSEQLFWISRLTPPIHEVKEANQLLKNYFEKNHKFRIGQVSFDEKFLTYSPILLDLEKESREASVKNF